MDELRGPNGRVTTSRQGSPVSRSSEAPSPEEAVAAWIAALNRRDVEAMCAGAHEDVVLEPTEYTAAPGTVFHGRAGVRSFLLGLTEQFPDFRVEPREFHVVPGGVVVPALVQQDSADRVERTILFELNDGLLHRVRSYATPAEALAASAAAAPRLTAREREILALLAGGMTAPEIADRLVLSPATIRTHVQNASSKLEASTRVQAIAKAIARGEISVEAAER